MVTMGRNHFVVDTKGYCLFCLKISTTSNINNPIESQVITDDAEISPNVISLQRFSHYLRLNRKKIFNDVISVSPTSLPVLEKSELKGVLCEECSQLTETISELTLELEVLQMTLDSCLLKIRDKIKGIGKDTKLKEDFKLEMLSNPQTLLHIGIVEQLQKEVLNKCSLLIGKAQPRIILKRCETTNPVATRHQFPLNDDRKTVHPLSAISGGEEEPELCESTPIISSVQGSYHGIVGKYPSVETINAMNIEHPSQIEFLMLDPLSDPGDSTVLGKPAPPFTSAPPPPVFVNTSRQCRFCPRTFQRHCLRRDHERAVHQGIKFSCGFCPATFSIRCSMQRHRRQFHKSGWRPFKVELEQSTSTPQSSHFEKSIPENIDSGALFLSKIALAPAPAPMSSPTCRVCHKTFKTEDIRREHEKIHSGIQYPCDLCPVKFTRRSNLRAHRIRVHKEMVGKQVDNNPSSLIYGNAALTSQYETGTVSGNPLLQAIEQVTAPMTTCPDQDQRNKFKCRTCHKTFTTNSVRLKHEKSIHQGIRYRCNLCPMVYTLMSSLCRHKRKMHNHGRRSKVSSALQFKIGNSERIEVNNEETDDLPNFLPEGDHLEDNTEGGLESDSSKCQHCNKQFKSLSSLRQHLTMVHDLRAGERKFECEFCGKRFIRNNIMLEHRRSVHLGTRYRCQLCPQEFTQVGSMKNHMKNSCPNRQI